MTETEQRNRPELFQGARRAQHYREGERTSAKQNGEAALDELLNDQREPAPPRNAATGDPIGLSPGAAPAQQRAATAQWGWRGRLNRGTRGLMKLAPKPAELGHREAIAAIRRATFNRAMNVIVTNPKGASGKTPTALLTAGILGHIRGGYIVVWEAAEWAGTLNRRAEGQPSRGLAELLADVGSIRSAGNLGGFTAPQSSHADVIGSVSARRVLTADDVLAARRVLDTYYRITVSDTGSNPGHEAYLAALRTADAAVLPCLPSLDALAGVEEALRVLDATGAPTSGPTGLRSRTVVVLSHDGGPEDPTIAAAVRARLAELDVAAVTEVPYDPAIRLGGQLSLEDLSEASTRAWTGAAAAVIAALRAAPTGIDLTAESDSAAQELTASGSPAAT